MLRRCERVCCGIATYFPLVFVYGMSTWAVWVEVHMGLLPETSFGERPGP
jgi:palmitoyltransferase